MSIAFLGALHKNSISCFDCIGVFVASLAFAFYFILLCLLPSGLIAWWQQESCAYLYGMMMLMNLMAGLGCTWWTHTQPAYGSFTVYRAMVLFWCVAMLSTALPFYICCSSVTLTDALFMAISGITTTGAEVMTDLASLPYSLLFLRHWLEFLGGLGVVIVMVFFRSAMSGFPHERHKLDLPGLSRDHAMGLNQSQTVQSLIKLYVFLWSLCFFGLWALGMSPHEAFAESLSTVSTGGFGLYNTNLAHYNHLTGVKIFVACMVCVASVSFITHVRVVRSEGWRAYAHDKECWMFLAFLCLGFPVIAWYMDQGQWLDGFCSWVFMLTTSGHSVSAYAIDSSGLWMLLLLICVVGGCSASTSGGVKQMRLWYAAKTLVLSLRLLLHPRMVFAWITGETNESRVAFTVYGYVFALLAMIWVSVWMLTLAGMSLGAAFWSTIACVTNTGQVIGEMAGGYSGLSYACKWILMLDMVIGRLEVLPVFAVLLAALDRKNA